MATVRLKVFANPYAALDGDGNPAGAFQEEGAPGVFIGATLVIDPKDGAEPMATEVLSGAATPPPRRFQYEPGPFEVPATSHYLYALRTGELLAADERTAREAGLTAFVPHEKALDASRKAAIASFKASHGFEPACELPDAAAIAPPAADAYAAANPSDAPRAFGDR